MARIEQTTARDQRTQRLLEAPVLSTLLRLAAPNIGEAAARVTFISLDAVFVAWIGTEALAGIAVVFPLFLVMQTVSAGGLGVGVASAIARALGAGRESEAETIAGNTVTMAVLVGVVCSIAMLALGPWLYGAIGLTGAALEQAITYSAIVFGGAVAVWTMNLLANVVRGTGNMLVPASAIVAGELAHVIISPTLILGLGPAPALGITGAAIGIDATYLVGALILAGYLVSRRGLLTVRAHHLRFNRAAIAAVLGVGTPAALNALQFQLATVVLSGFVATFGTAATAGFGAAARLELLQVPIVFAFGSAIVTMVATSTGAGDLQRARRITWCGGAIAAGIGTVFMLAAVLLPQHWMALFSGDASVVDGGVRYLRTVGPVYPLFASALAIFFASQGAGYGVGPFLASTTRLVVIAAGGWLAVDMLGGGVADLYLVTGGAFIISSTGIVYASRAVLWPRPMPALAATG